MCGIAGIYFRTGAASHGPIQAMTNAMSHRGPDAYSHYEDDHVSLGHRRLSIIDLSDAANQPFRDPTGRYIMVFNGEIYNFREIRQNIRSWTFRTSSDTEVLLAAYLEWGPAFLDRCKGMFALAIWDNQEQSMFLCRDRLGVKPLYYVLQDAYLLFASEIRGILASGLHPRVLDREMVPDYLSFQSFGFPGSPIKGIEQLEAGTYMIVTRDQMVRKVYWAIGSSPVPMEGVPVTDIQKNIRTLLGRSVEQRMISDVPIGAFLSGGIDSSAVVALMREVTDTRIATFNVAFREKDYDESAYAEIVARKFHTDHHTITVNAVDFLSELIPALDAMDSPSADGINTYVVSKAIRKAGMTVALSGIGGDELFAGYPFFKQYVFLRKLNALGLPGKLARSLAAALAGFSRSSTADKARALLSVEEPLITHFYPEFRRIVPSKTVMSMLSGEWNGKTVFERWMDEQRPRLEKLPWLSQVSGAEYLGYTQHTLLKDTDQMSMAVSLEVREPFFDHELINYVLSVPDSIKNPGYPKQLLVESLKPLLPEEVVFRKKQGFLFPWSIWMRSELLSFCQEKINNLCTRDFVNADEVMSFWKRFVSGDPRVRWTEPWTLVVLEHWMEKNQVS